MSAGATFHIIPPIDTTFQIELPGPSFNNTRLYERYVCAIESQARQSPLEFGTFLPFIRVKKRMRVNRQQKPSWEIDVFNSFTSRITISVKPLDARPHIANVSVAWNPRLHQWLIGVFVVMIGLVAIPSCIMAAQFSHVPVAALLLAGSMIVIMCTLVSLMGVAITSRLLGAAFADKLRRDRIEKIAEIVRRIPVPTHL
jgi:hypothetical protein